MNTSEKGYLPLSFLKVLNLFSLAAHASQHLRQGIAVVTLLVRPIRILPERRD